MSKLINILETFCRTEAYDAAVLNCYAFRRGTDERNGIVLSLGNMVSGYPFEIEGIRFENSECAYIAGAFSSGTPHHLALQRQLTVCTNGFMAKKGIRKPHDSEVRADWEVFNVEWMKYVVWQKCLGNSDFRKLLLSLPDNAIIIEDSTFQAGCTATVWGTRNVELKKRLNAYKKELKAQGYNKAAIKRECDTKRLGEWSQVGVFVGRNVMGKILMACRRALVNGTEPNIDYALLQEAHINLLGKELTFNQYVKAA
ncbi:MAG: NADAR family protein [Muribaculaceae bacterium]|nr:NADAR family protein [Muribaculaceae bacterium]